MISRIKRVSTTAARAKSPAVMRPQLTSLIDVMTILLVFLLKSFSAEGNLITVSPDLDLPASTSKQNPVPALNIEVTPEQVAVDGSPVATVRQVEENDSLMIDNLYQKLVEAMDGFCMAGNQGRIIIQCDRSVDFSVLKKVMFTCGKANLSNFSLLVMESV